MADITKISVSGTQYDVKDSDARSRLTAIEGGTTTLTKVSTGSNPATANGDVVVGHDLTVAGAASVTGNTTLSGDLTVAGNITQQGSSYETHAEQVYTKKDMIITRDGATGGLAVGQYTGIQAKKYDGTNDGQLVFDKDGVARVGDVGSLQALATREDNPTDNYMPYWDAATSKFCTTLPTFNIICSSNAGDACIGTIGTLTNYPNGMTIKVLFINGHYGSTFTLNIDGQGAKPIWVNKDGSPAAMSSNSLDRDGTERNWYVQPYTTLELMYVASLNGNAGAWLVIGNPVVLSSSTSGYTIYANGFIVYSAKYINDNTFWNKCTVYFNSIPADFTTARNGYNSYVVKMLIVGNSHVMEEVQFSFSRNIEGVIITSNCYNLSGLASQAIIHNENGEMAYTLNTPTYGAAEVFYHKIY